MTQEQAKAERAPRLSPEEQRARLLQGFTEADLKALQWVPPGPDPVEVQAARGVAWARKLMRTRRQHASHRSVDANGYCHACQLLYPEQESQA